MCCCGWLILLSVSGPSIKLAPACEGLLRHGGLTVFYGHVSAYDRAISVGTDKPVMGASPLDLGEGQALAVSVLLRALRCAVVLFHGHNLGACVLLVEKFLANDL